MSLGDHISEQERIVNEVIGLIVDHLVGMTGIFYACYELSRGGWYCLPTIRNTAGVDIVAYSLDGNRTALTDTRSTYPNTTTTY